MRKRNLNNLRRVLKVELQENINLLKPKVEENNWPSKLLSDTYIVNQVDLKLLPDNELSEISSHYSDVRRFQEAIRDAIEGGRTLS